MENENTITYKGKILANHFIKENGNWLIVWKKEITEREKVEFSKKVSEMANRLNLKVEFRNDDE